MKIKRCLLGIIVLGALAAGAGWAAPAAAGSAGGGKQDASDSAGGGDQGARHGHDQGGRPGPAVAKQHKGATASTEARRGASRPSRKAPDRAIATAPSAGTKALATAAMTPSHLAAVPHFGPNAPGATIVAAVPANAAPRHILVKASLGGPAAADAKHGGLIVVAARR